MAGNKNSGRPKKPTGLKVIQGTAQKCRLNEDEPDFGVDLQAPPHLTDEEKTVWFDCARLLIPAGVLTEGDAIALEALVTKYVEWVGLKKSITEDGLIIEGPRGGKTVNPMIKLERTAHDQLMRGLQQFGMTPVARSNVRAPQKRESPAGNMFGSLRD